jgi:hypothetical protein
VTGDNLGDRERAAADTGRRAPAGELLRLPGVGIAAAAIAVVSLGLGVIIGRATVSTSAGPDSAQPALRPERERGAKADKPKREREQLSADQYRLQVGRNVPNGKHGGGFERQRVAGRHVGRLTDESVLRFELVPSSDQYALLAVLGMESGQGTVAPTLDGQSLGTWSVGAGWEAFYAPVPSQLLQQPAHELVLNRTVTGENAIDADGVAVVPVGDGVRFTMGEESVGHLVEGFANRSGRSVWNIGPRSLVAVALVPAAAPYRLTVHAAALPAVAPLTVSCKVNGTDIGTAEFGRKAAESGWDVPAKLLRSGLNRIEFFYAKTAVPADLDTKSTDRRQLALRFAELQLAPKEDAPSNAASAR